MDETFAAEMCISRHTVGDYIKLIFEKCRATSRGELVAKLFTEHLFDGHKSATAYFDLDPATLEVLRRWRTHRTEEDAEFDAADVDARVFSRPDGSATHPHLLSDAFKRLVERSGLPRIRFHDLRHTHATLLLKAGVPIKVVSERLGHSTPGFTMAVPARHPRDAGASRSHVREHPRRLRRSNGFDPVELAGRKRAARGEALARTQS